MKYFPVSVEVLAVKSFKSLKVGRADEKGSAVLKNGLKDFSFFCQLFSR
jgi:hypothetical protein